MKRIPMFAALAAVAALVALGLAASGSGKSGKASKVIRVHAELTSIQQVDNAPAGESAGDLLVFTERLSRRGRTIGEATGSCALVRPPTLYQCTSTASLPKGTLAIAGTPDLSEERSKGAIAGGTGRYRRARGTVRVRAVGEGQEVITYRVLD